MGFRFRKSIKAGPLRINLSKSGVGYSFGVKGARISHSATGRKRATFSIPGTGLSYSKSLSHKRRKTTKRAATHPKKGKAPAKSYTKQVPTEPVEPIDINLHTVKGWLTLIGVILVTLVTNPIPTLIGVFLLCVLWRMSPLYICVPVAVAAAVAIVVAIAKHNRRESEPNAEAENAPPALEAEQKPVIQDISYNPESDENPTARTTTYTLNGVFKCEKEIFRDLMEENPAYEYTKRDLIDNAMTDYPVYKWVPAMLPARLVPEPDNPYDKNAIRVFAGETMIGYIPKEKCLEVQKIIDEERLLNVAYEITGGKYKLVTEDYDPDTDKSTYTLDSGYEEVAAKVYIK